MTLPSFTLLRRKAWIDRRIEELHLRRDASPISLLRLKALRLMVETRLKGVSRSRPAHRSGYAY